MSKYVLAIGELLIDAISSDQVEDLSQAAYLNVHPGGSTGNFCRYLKRCGTDAKIVASVGHDGFGKTLLRKISEEGLSTAHIDVLGNHFTSMIVVGRSPGTPDFIPYRDADIFIPDVLPALISGASLVHSTAFALSREPARSRILKAFRSASQHGIPISVDWNYSGKIWYTAEEANMVLTEIQQYRPMLKFSLDDVSRFLERPTSIKEALHFLGTINASLICLTCGADGVYYKVGGSKDWAFLAAKKIAVKNATGAGDSFWAGYIHSYISGLPVIASVRGGIKTASDKLQGLLKVAK